MDKWKTVWTFKTDHFCVKFEVTPDYDADLSFDETGEVADRINRGLFDCFVARIAVQFEGWTIGEDYLGACIYESPQDFIGDGYFRDMVRIAIDEARKEFAKKKEQYTAIRLRAA